jgi:membrane-bound metal-dependent hydrolase YbcI (DUF457 family)
MKREPHITDTKDTQFLAGTTQRTRKANQLVPYVEINAVSDGNHTKHKDTNFQRKTDFLTAKIVVHIFTIVLLVMNEKYTILKLENLSIYCLKMNVLSHRKHTHSLVQRTVG